MGVSEDIVKQWNADFEKNRIYWEEYTANNNRKLNKMAYTIFKGFNLPSMYYDDIYSIANEQLFVAGREFDPTKECSFNTFLVTKLTMKIRTFVRDLNREKRNPGKNIKIVCIDEETEDGIQIEEVIASDYSLEEEIFGTENEKINSKKIQEYLNHLSKIQREIIWRIAYKFSEEEICNELNISKREYKSNMKCIKDYRNISILL